MGETWASRKARFTLSQQPLLIALITEALATAVRSKYVVGNSREFMIVLELLLIHLFSDL